MPSIVARPVEDAACDALAQEMDLAIKSKNRGSALVQHTLKYTAAVYTAADAAAAPAVPAPPPTLGAMQQPPPLPLPPRTPAEIAGNIIAAHESPPPAAAAPPGGWPAAEAPGAAVAPTAWTGDDVASLFA